MLSPHGNSLAKSDHDVTSIRHCISVQKNNKIEISLLTLSADERDDDRHVRTKPEMMNGEYYKI